MPNADLDPDAIAISVSEIDASISVRLGDNRSPYDSEVENTLRHLVGDLVNVDDVIEGLKASHNC